MLPRLCGPLRKKLRADHAASSCSGAHREVDTLHRQLRAEEPVIALSGDARRPSLCGARMRISQPNGARPAASGQQRAVAARKRLGHDLFGGGARVNGPGQ